MFFSSNSFSGVTIPHLSPSNIPVIPSLKASKSEENRLPKTRPNARPNWVIFKVLAKRDSAPSAKICSLLDLVFSISSCFSSIPRSRQISMSSFPKSVFDFSQNSLNPALLAASSVMLATSASFLASLALVLYFFRFRLTYSLRLITSPVRQSCTIISV